MPGDDKTEKATPKKRRDAREKEGKVLQSKEIVTAVSILGTFAALAALSSYIFISLTHVVEDGISAVGAEFTNDISSFQAVFLDVAKDSVMIVLPLCVIVAFIVVISVMAQTRGLFTMKPLKPKFSKLNPLNGIKNMFSAQSAVGILKGIIELAAIIAIVYGQVESRMIEIVSLVDTEPIYAVAYIANTVFNIVMILCVIFVFVAAGDFLFQWWQFEKNLKMSKQEVKDEYKQTEGDPQIKGKIKQKQREMAQARMMEQVPGADVVVRNPTHYAVALKYDIEMAAADAAPLVVAKGQDALALRIIKIAEEHNVYITENRALARELYETVDIGKQIPFKLFNAVAVILTEMYTAKGILDNMTEAASRRKMN
ncbi:MAG: flagellar biosynthesis protein FlhB [Ruminiclostridium sp.]|nr:flagellar biosynthesis protein FlhB [Ruminiclostridium sp.]